MQSSILASLQRTTGAAPRYWPIVPTVLLASALLGLSASGGELRRALVLLVGVGVTAVIVRSPVLGLAGIVVASLLVPIEFGTGTGTGMGINLVGVVALSGVWILRAVTRKDESLLPKSRTVAPVLLLCLVALLSLGIGQLKLFAFAEGAPLRAQLGGLATFVLSASVFLLTATQVQSIEWIRRLTWLFIAIGALIALSRLFGGALRFVGDLTSRGSTGSLFWTWLAAMALAQALFNSHIRRHWRIGLAGLVLTIFYLNLFHLARWASGWIPALIAVVAVLWIGMPRIAAWLSAAGAVALTITPGWTQRFIFVGDNEYSLLTRLEAWRIVAEIVRVSPILGLGPSNYYWYAPLFPILGYSVRFSSHNNYVDLVAQTGILGLLCFIGFAVAMAVTSWRLIKILPDGFARAYVIGSLGGLAGTLAAGMLGDWVIPFVYNVGFDGMRASLLGWLFLGGTIALEQLVERQDPKLAETPI